jgi:hypothetical protein
MVRGWSYEWLEAEARECRFKREEVCNQGSVR